MYEECIYLYNDCVNFMYAFNLSLCVCISASVKASVNICYMFKFAWSYLCYKPACHKIPHNANVFILEMKLKVQTQMTFSLGDQFVISIFI